MALKYILVIILCLHLQVKLSYIFYSCTNVLHFEKVRKYLFFGISKEWLNSFGHKINI